ncbi:MAG: hypothetical protein WBP26_05600 [Candidatus Saccharimonadales bacterium]
MSYQWQDILFWLKAYSNPQFAQQTGFGAKSAAKKSLALFASDWRSGIRWSADGVLSHPGIRKPFVRIISLFQFISQSVTIAPQGGMKMLQITKIIGSTLVVIVAVLLILIVTGVLEMSEFTDNIGKILAVAGIVLAATGIIVLLGNNKPKK